MKKLLLLLVLLASATLFAQSAFDGTWTGWYEDGSKQKVATYQRGTKTGEQEFPRASN